MCSSDLFLLCLFAENLLFRFPGVRWCVLNPCNWNLLLQILKSSFWPTALGFRGYPLLTLIDGSSGFITLVIERCSGSFLFLTYVGWNSYYLGILFRYSFLNINLKFVFIYNNFLFIRYRLWVGWNLSLTRYYHFPSHRFILAYIIPPHHLWHYN